MDVIRELYSLIKKLMGRKSPFLPVIFQEKYLYTKLLNGVVEGKYQNENEAEIDIASYNDAGSQSYPKTKQRLIEKLLSLVCTLNLDNTTYSLYLVNHFHAKRELFVAEVMQWFGLPNAMYYIITRRTLKKAKKYDLTDVKLGCYKLLRNYESKHGTITKCEKYTQKVHDTLAILHLESRVENVRSRLNAHLAKQVVLDDEIIKQLDEQIAWIKGDVTRYPTRTVVINYCISAGRVHRLKGEFSEAYTLYQQYLTFLNDNPALANDARRAEACYYLVRCCLLMRDFDNGFRYAKLRSQYQDTGNMNGFAFMETYCLLCIHSKQYVKSAEIFRWAKNQKNLYKDDRIVEKWGIYEAYIRLFLADKESAVIPRSVTIYGDNFNVHRLLNEIDVTRQDRRGINVTVLIFQVLYLLKEQKYVALDERIQYMQEYVSKVMRSGTSLIYFRTECFFRMLNIARENQYSFDKTQRATAELFRKMTAFRSPDIFDRLFVEEVIPHEQSWQIFMDTLQHEIISVNPAEPVKTV